MSPSPTVCFDLDGVLVDTEPIWERVRRRFAERHGGRWTGDLQEKMMGVQTRDWSTALSDAIGGQLTSEEVATTVIDDLAGEYRQHLPVIVGAVSAVRRLAEEATLGLVSGSPHTLIALVLDLTRLTDSFQVAMSADEVEKGKPAPDPYIGLARRLAAAPASCVAVEDSANGIHSAHSAGMAVVAIPRGEHRPARDVLRLADAVLDDISQLTPEVVRRLAGRPQTR
jgi:HAD superfamily hydrolase (TIGR01509 family)